MILVHNPTKYTQSQAVLAEMSHISYRQLCFSYSGGQLFLPSTSELYMPDMREPT